MAPKKFGPKHKFAIVCRSFLIAWLEVGYDHRCLIVLINVFEEKDEKTEIDKI